MSNSKFIPAILSPGTACFAEDITPTKVAEFLDKQEHIRSQITFGIKNVDNRQVWGVTHARTPSEQANFIRLMNALAQQLPHDAFMQIFNAEAMPSYERFEMMISVQRKSDHGRVTIYVKDALTAPASWDTLMLDDVAKATLILFLQP